VVSDNRAGAEALTRHLLLQGHRRIGFIAGPAYARNAVERLDGFRQAMCGAEGAESLIAAGEFSARHGAEAVLDWMQRPGAPTAIIAINDSIALGALEAITGLGLRVPEDVALAGFDGVRMAASPILNLTTVDQHIDQMGRRAVRALLRQLGAGPGAEPIHEVLPTQLLARRSTGALPAAGGAEPPR
jgi:DNA-binding LacI/PurR family transcriptional regulator